MLCTMLNGKRYPFVTGVSEPVMEDLQIITAIGDHV